MSSPFLLDSPLASKPASTEVVLDNLDEQVKALPDGEAFGRFLDGHPLLVTPE